MAKRRIEDETQLEEKKAPLLIADANTNVIYQLQIFCVRCARSTTLTLHAKDLPSWAPEFLKTVRFDDPLVPCTEKDRTKEWLANKKAIKHSLELQALCEPTMWSEKKKNKCVRDDVLNSLKQKHPEITHQQFWNIDQTANLVSFDKIVSGYEEILTPNVRFVPENSILCTGRVTILEHWRDDIK